MTTENTKYKAIDPTQLPKHFDSKEAEQRWDAFWQKNAVYHFDPTQTSAPIFSIDTPPPTVSGSLHIGHVFSYTQTDIQARFERMSGKNVFYPMGWDDNGLPTERRVQNYFHIRCDMGTAYEPNLKLEQASAKDRKNPARLVSRANFIELCQQVTQEDEKIFMHLFKRIGLSVDWREEYSTIDDRCRKLSQYSFIDLFQKKHVFNLEAPTMWDTDFQTAVAQAEVEDRETPGAYHKIEFGIEGLSESFTIATTRPELLPACVGITAHPSDKRYQHLFGKKAISPVFFAPVEIFPSELADPEKGSGILMVCTFGDATDLFWWREHKLPLRQIIERNGRLKEIQFGTESFPSARKEQAQANYAELVGKNLKQARTSIIELLRRDENSSCENKNAPLQAEPEAIQHAVKFYEKGDRPLEFVTTRQWFVKLIDKKNELLQMGEKIKWHPPFMFSRFKNWTENLQLDWCISRQRYFGVPIPVWYPLDQNSKPQYDRPILATLDQLPVDPAIDCPKNYSENQRGQPQGFIGDLDVFDTWFTSSITPQISSKWILDEEKYQKLFPMELRPQGHDIIRTWAFYTIAKSLLHENQVPWKNIALSGWILDPDRKKMSKSKGNVVTPEHLLDEYSSDAIRYWAGSARLGADTAFDEQVLKIGRRLVTKLYNASKFVLMQEAPVSPITEALDQSFIESLNQLVTRVTNQFNQFQYANALQETEKFFWSSFTDVYIELVKHRAKEGSGAAQASAVASLRLGLKTLLKLFSPFLPFICEEVWSWSFAEEDKAKSIHQSRWPKAEDFKSRFDPAGEANHAVSVFEIAQNSFTQINKLKSENQISHSSAIPSLNFKGSKEGMQALKASLDDLRAATKFENFQMETIEQSQNSIEVQLDS